MANNEEKKMMRNSIVVIVLFVLLPFYCFFQSSTAAAFSVVSFPGQSDSPLIANFTYTPKDIVVNQLVSFYDHSSGPVAFWFWDFGDGATANATVKGEANKTHVYTAVGDYPVGLTVFDGSGGQGNSSFYETLIGVRRINTTLSLNMPDSGSQGGSFSLTAVLKDEYEAPVDGALVSFFVVDGQNESSVGFGLTDSLGRVSISYTPPGSGVFQVRAVFDGTDVYAEASSDVKALRVGYDLVPFAVLASVLVLVMSGVLAYVRLKRRGEEKEESSPEKAEEEEE